MKIEMDFIQWTGGNLKSFTEWVRARDKVVSCGIFQVDGKWWYIFKTWNHVEFKVGPDQWLTYTEIHGFQVLREDPRL